MNYTRTKPATMKRKSEQPFQPVTLASETSGFSQYQLRKGIKDGWVPHVRSGNKYLVNVPALMEQMNRQSETTMTR